MDVLVIVLLVLGLYLFSVLITRGKSPREYPYRITKSFLSKAEQSFYGVLVNAVGSTGLVFPKVRVADVITPKKGMSRSDWLRAFNAVSAKHFDFLICDPQDCTARLAVELDDSSHVSQKSQRGDKVKNRACESAGLPLLRVKAARAYVIADIRHQIEQAIPATSELVSAPGEVPDKAESVAQGIEVAPGIYSYLSESSAQGSSSQEGKLPNCPRCGELMVRRVSQNGANQGQEFWGCGTFPKCRGTAGINT